MSSEQGNNSRLTFTFFLLLFAYFALHIVLRVVISDSLDYDEAEQAMLSQWLLPGYTEQPPLYTWIQYGLFQLFGKNVFSVSLLKNSLLFFTYVFVYFSSKEVLRDTKLAVLASCSLLLIPQIGWESQRDMTHTTLVVFAASATLYQVMRLVRSQSLFNYLLLGLAVGVGFLAKANFGIFLTVIILSLLTAQEGRRLLFDRRFLLALLIAALINSSYLYWMYTHQDIVFASTHKFKRALENYYIKGPESLLTNSFLFLTPLWIFYLLFFPAGFGPRQSENESFGRTFIGRYILFLFIVLLIVVLAFKVTYVKDRWLQPLLFAFPIFFFARLSSENISAKRFRRFCKIAIVAACCIYTAFAIRVVGASYIDRFCRLNYPFDTMAESIRKLGFDKGLIISRDRFLAGNMHFIFPESAAIVPNYRFESLPQNEKFTTGLVVWKADKARNVPIKVAGFLQKTYDIDVTKYRKDYLIHRYKYGRTENVTLGVMQIPLKATTVGH